MAGMLPGVECARRRRFHQGGSNDQPSGARRTSFCLYTSSHDTHISTNNSMQRKALNKDFHGGGLGHIAREAKERLDERLRSQPAMEIERIKSGGGGKGSVLDPMMVGLNVQREVFDTKKRSRRFSWIKFGWKSSDQAECAVCLEEFRGGEILVHLPCAHRFHRSCVVPWLESSPHCPCCRMTIFS